ncbi:RRP12-like protein [Phymastichus coffea]|uniref:RRP12-like protein n=1 Tax=Phymastichus coffea TaxID=108790 RepID=UPI00273B2A5B|nr:RRP12-like protein [Phymastichus coffea]XP_058797317.1 RRP12-like protein [Phymastichus coffea]XP_058797318.1 RRP12-like protein [Phymastichus coffea]XP_058797319.1 RRP12-like protein [Phymastichus coffea]
MGKLGPRLSSRKKAKRWAKGQSSSSNPETKTFRDQARSRFFQLNPDTNSKGLTIDILKKHDAMQGIESHDDRIDIDESSLDGGDTFKTFGTFASDYSNCSNISFNRFLNHFQSNSAMHKEMLAVLAAVTDVIKQNGGTESSTEYYAALMTTLEAAETVESISAILSLLGMGMKTVPKNVLKLQFGQASQIFLKILTKFSSEDNFLIIRHCIGCLSILLRNQERAIWKNSSTEHILNSLLAFTVHSKPKVRKAAQHAICSLLKGSDIMRTDNPPTNHPAASLIAKHCIQQLQAAGQPGHMTTTLHLLTLLKDIVHQLPKCDVKSLCEVLLSIMLMKDILVTSCCLQTMHSLFISKPSEAILPSQLNAQIINALYEHQPARGDTQPTLAWLAVMQEAHCNLAVHNIELCAANLSRIVEKCTELWLSDKQDVRTNASHTLTALLETCVAPLCKKKELSDKYRPTLAKIISLIQQGMKYPYHDAWHQVLHISASIFTVIGPICQTELTYLLKALAELRDFFQFSYNADIEFAVGAAVKSLGPQVVLSAIPLQVSNGIVDLKRSWLLPILKDCITNSPLAYFIDNLLPLAESCDAQSNDFKGKYDAIGSHSYDLLSSQIWALLPCFCNNPPDIKENFMKIAKTLGMAISQRKNLRLSVMTSLRKLIQKSMENDNQDGVEELARFAKNYLPVLFNLYTLKPRGSDEEGQRLACYETIKIYMKITSKDLVGELFDKALENLTKTNETDFFKESIFDLVRVLCQHTDIDRIKLLYEKCTALFEDTKHQKEQKKAYRFLEEITGSETVVCQEFVKENRKAIQKVIVKSLTTVQKSSKGARIRCINHLVNKHPQLEKTKFLQAIVPEAVMCLKEVNERCRTSSYNLLNSIANKFLENEEHLKEYIDILIAGLGGAPIYCSASLLALSSITYHYNGSLGIQTVQKILEFTCNLVIGPTREIALSALSFIKVYLSVIPTPTIAPMLNKIVDALTNMTDDCKRHFRQKVRDILIKLMRKFGADIITNIVPTSDHIMHKRLKNIRKVELRKQKLKETRKANKDDESDEEFNVKRKPKSLEEILADSDQEFSDSDECKKIQKRKSTKKTWIQEGEDNIVDFIDPTAIKNISATKPSKTKNINLKNASNNRGFKTASDGRLIIADSDNDSADEMSKKKKKKLPFLDGDSDEDLGDDDMKSAKSTKTAKSTKSNKTTEFMNRKRKLSTTEIDSVHSESKSLSSKYQAGGSGIHRPLKSRKKENNFGEEYRAQKAFGDVKRKGKPDPYAYIPLKRSMLNRRNKVKNDAFKNILSRSKKDKHLRKNSRNKKK